MNIYKHGELDEFIQWYDEDGNIINVSDGGVIYAEGKYHWYGQALRPLPVSSKGSGGQSTTTGVVMYESDDLLHWKYEGVILACSKDSTHDLYAPMRLERPKIIYNEKTKQYVLWCHYVKYPGDHGFEEGTGEAGVAVCDTVNGNYTWLGYSRPIDNEGMVRDCTVYKDKDGSAYIIYDRENISNHGDRCIYIVKLTEDYLSYSKEYRRIDVAFRREAASIVHHEGYYYMLTSGLTGWNFNQANYYRAKELFGPWEDMGDPCVNDDTKTAFQSQSTYIFKVEGTQDLYIYMAERHNVDNFVCSSYIWLPIEFCNDHTLKLHYLKEWQPVTTKYAGREYDASWREPMWERVYRDLGSDDRALGIVRALKTMYTMYTDDLVEWYANLYDPYYGAWYCTTSGKENEGFLPDIESTSMALQFINDSGLIDHLGGDWTKVLPDEMKKKIIKFAKRMQEPNGFFYNFLKTVEQGDAALGKRGRDVGWCTIILNELCASPTYDTPNGIKGDGIDYEGKSVANQVIKVDKELAPAANSYPDYLENKDTFLNYLNNEVDIVNESYYYGNQLNGTYSQIKARDIALREAGCDYSLCDVFIDWLNERIDPVTGYWSPKTTFEGTNGYFKVIVIYNAWGYPYPALEKAADSVIAGILGDEPSTGNICEVYNLWSALISTKENAKRCHNEETKKRILAKINGLMMENGEAAIVNTYKKQSAYQMPDGAYAHTVTTCLTEHQGSIPVGLGLVEGDVDAIGKATTGIVNNIFNAYEIERVPIYSKREWEKYFSIMQNAKPVIKTKTKTYR